MPPVTVPSVQKLEDYIPLPTYIYKGQSDINAKDNVQEIIDKVKNKLRFSEFIRIKFSSKSLKYYSSNLASVNQACKALGGLIEIY